MNPTGASDAPLDRSPATVRGRVRRGRGALRIALFLGGLGRFAAPELPRAAESRA